MAGVAIRFGVILILLGAVFFLLSSPHAPTSLIPAYFGLLLLLLGMLARTDDVKRRMMVMHLAATLGLVGFLFPLVRAFRPAIAMIQGEVVARPRAVQEEILMALACLIFLVLCIRSFIAARRQRLAS